MTQTQHTPAPWTNKASASSLVITRSYPDNDDYSPIATVFYSQDAEFIVRACNIFDELVAALDTLTKQVNEMNNIQHAGGQLIPEEWSELYRYCNIAREAIRKARGEA